MSIRNLIILSQLNPPAQRGRVLNRRRVSEKLERVFNFPLTIIEAGTGYGKSTALSSFLIEIDAPIYWYAISGTDRDPKLFLAKLFSAFNQRHENIGDEALRILDMPDATAQEAMIAFINSISTNLAKDALFILEDFHRVEDIPEIMRHINWMINRMPQKLHLIISTRHKLELSDLNKWRVKNSLMEITKEDLAFTTSEIQQLFHQQYEMQLADREIEQLEAKTEGWAIGLQVIWQTLQRNPDLGIREVFEDDRFSKSALFEYLAEEVLSGLPTDIQNFLLSTSILSKMDSSTCDFLLNRNDSEKKLLHLQNIGMFIEELQPGVFRYHQIFRDFLSNRLKKNAERAQELHYKIASYFRAHEYWEEALYHLLVVGDYHQINQILESIGDRLIKEGRHETINYWIQEIPVTQRKDFPYIYFLLGEVHRYLGKFDEALENYHIAERFYRERESNSGISMSLRGQAQVFLDTIRPVNADQLLQDALSLLDAAEMPNEVADLLVLTAENQLNLGFPDSAQTLLSRAKDLSSTTDDETDVIQARIYLRTGRLQEGIKLLKEREVNRITPTISRPQRFHRESDLLLSLFYAMMGDIENAEKYARKGIELGEALKSLFVQAVGYMRLGHAIILQSLNPFMAEGFNLAMQSFQVSIDKVDVVRIHVEPLWGMCHALGCTDQIEKAKQRARDSLSIAHKAGDIWISILIQLSVGAGCVIAGDFDSAQDYLTNAESSSIKVKDPFCLSNSYLWLAIKAWKQGFENTALGYLEKMILIIKKHHFEFLLSRETLLGLRDREEIIPILISAKEHKIQTDFIHQTLETQSLENERYHPGHTLWVRTLGSFSVWQASKKIERQDWKREKTFHLFQLLVGFREKWLHRDQILSMLWPETPTENASNYLKVVFSTLNTVLEPDRPKGEPAFFIERDQERYRLNPKARIIIDADLFLQHIDQGNTSDLTFAVNLYKGHYFSDSYIQEWLMIDEQYFHQKFLLGSEKLINNLIDQKKYQQALEITHKVLAQDNLWESAYQAQMIIFHHTGQPGMIRKVYDQCQDIFQNLIQSPVSENTLDLFNQLTSGTENSKDTHL
jgi:DNA-binding SARP family transcriptional activator